MCCYKSIYNNLLNIPFGESSMSNFKIHALAGILFGLPFVPSVFYLFFALLGASIPDLDHKNNENKVYSMFVVGVILAVILSIGGLMNISALIIILLAVIFYLSKHRGFTHTFIGICVLSFLFTLVVMGFIPLINDLLIINEFAWSNTILLFLVMVLVGFFVISRKYYLLYVTVLAIYLILFPVDYSNIDGMLILTMFLIGAISHIILDLCTSSGVSVFKPLSNKKYHKSLAILLFSIWIILSISSFYANGFLYSLH